MGTDALAQRIDKSPEEAIAIQDLLFGHLKKVKQMIEQKGEYCVEHDGQCESILGDRLMMEDEPDRWARLGINQVIQSFAAVSLAQGFEKCIEESLHTDEIKVRPLNVVHDSSQNYFDTTKLFEIYNYYHRCLSDYLFDLYGVRYEFDLEVGANYYDMCHLKQLDETHIQLSANYTSLKGVLDKCITEGLKFKFDEFKDSDGNQLPINGLQYPDEFKPKRTERLVEVFYEEGGYAGFDRDTSKFTVILSKC